MIEDLDALRDIFDDDSAAERLMTSGIEGTYVPLIPANVEIRRQS